MRRGNGAASGSNRHGGRERGKHTTNRTNRHTNIPIGGILNYTKNNVGFILYTSAAAAALAARALAF